MKQYDIIVVGTGGATIVADAAIKVGKKVAIIEKGKFGGTCLTRGCIPTKVMVTAANVMIVIVIAAPPMLIVAPNGIDTEYISGLSFKRFAKSRLTGMFAAELRVKNA